MSELKFISAFTPKTRGVKKVRETLKIEKQEKVTKIYFPTEFNKCVKGDKIVITTTEGMEDLYLVKLTEGITAINPSVYNVGDNSINSAPVSEIILNHFNVEGDNAEFSFELLETETIYALKITGIKKEESVEESTDDSEEIEEETESTQESLPIQEEVEESFEKESNEFEGL